MPDKRKRKRKGVLAFGERKPVSTTRGKMMSEAAQTQAVESVARVAGRSINEATLQRFLQVRIDAHANLQEDDNPSLPVNVDLKVPLRELEAETLALLADAIEVNTTTVRTMKSMGPSDIKSMTGGLNGRFIKGRRADPDRVMTSMDPRDGMAMARKGKGDVGTNPSSSPKGGNNPGMAMARKGKGDTGSNPPGKPRKQNSGMKTRAKMGKGDVGMNEADAEAANVIDLLTRQPREVPKLEDVDSGYPKAERLAGGQGPNVTKGKRYPSPGAAGAKKVGMQLSPGMGPKVQTGRTTSKIMASEEGGSTPPLG